MFRTERKSLLADVWRGEHQAREEQQGDEGRQRRPGGRDHGDGGGLRRREQHRRHQRHCVIRSARAQSLLVLIAPFARGGTEFVKAGKQLTLYLTWK